jgi:hypothetical protein
MKVRNKFIMVLTQQHDTGRIVWRYKNLVKHTGVMAGKDEYGRDMVIHNHPFSGATVVTFAEFADGKPVKYDNRPCTYDSYTVWRKAIESVNKGTSYSLLTSNCQHLTSNACHGRNESEDLEAFAKGVLAVGAFFLGASFLSSLGGRR